MLSFGTNGVRGLFSELTPEEVVKISRASALYLGKKIAIARDGRKTGESLKAAAISGVLSAGADAYDLGVVPTPTAELMAKLYFDGAIIITASHNPPEWNAVKVSDGYGKPLSKERGKEVERLFSSKPVEWKAAGELHPFPNAIDIHQKLILEKVDREKIKSQHFFFILDAGNGTAAKMIPLFKKLGVEVIAINDELSPFFPGRPSEPTERHLEKLKEVVVKLGADGGIAWDGDGDRVVFVDEKGDFVPGDVVLALAVLTKKGKKGRVATTVATSKVVEATASSLGMEIEYTKVGVPYLSEAVFNGAILAGEEVGGAIWPELSYSKDGFMTAAKIVELLAREEVRLSSLVSSLPKFYMIKEKVPCAEEKKKAVMERIRIAFKEKFQRVMEIDGVRADFDGGWIIARPSGTEPYIRVFAEHEDKSVAEELIAEWKSVIERFVQLS